MAPTIWFSLLSVSLVISLTPGAGAINTMSNAMTAGWRRSFWGILGQQLALLVHIAITAAGVGLVVAGSPLLFNIIRYAGAAYLVYLGVRLFRAQPPAVGEDGEGDAAVVAEPAGGTAVEATWSIIRRGFWVNLLNPKAIVFFLAFIPQFIVPSEPLLPQYLVLTGTVVLIDTLVMWFFFAAAAKPFQRYSATPRGFRVINRVFGALFLVVAVFLAVLH